MVQYPHDSYYSRDRMPRKPNLYSPGHYWKVPNFHDMTGAVELRGYLKRQGFRWDSTKNEGRLRYLCSRAARDMISYEACKMKELQKFCHDKGLKSAISKRKKKELIQILEDDDEKEGKVQFGRFMGLPAELRCLVYAEYLNWNVEHLGEGLSSAIDLGSRKNEALALLPPPMAETSRICRNEVLPVFFDSFRLSIDVTNWGYEMDDYVRRLFEHGPLHYLSRVHKARICGSIALFNGNDRDVYFNDEWLINLPTETRAATMERAKGDHRYRDPEMIEEQEQAASLLESKMQILFNHISARPSGKALRRGDLQSFADVFNEVQNHMEADP